MKSSYRFATLITVTGMILFPGCVEKYTSLPIVTTFDATKVTSNSAYSGGNILSSGSSQINSRGVCWSINPEPGTDDSKTIDGTGSGDFVSYINGLKPASTYYFRAYATNETGTAYGNEISTTTSPEDTIAMDPDGNIYHFIAIGSQIWMKENLMTTKYADGSPIATTNPVTIDISLEPAPKYEWPVNGDGKMVSVYGRLYTGFALVNNQVCPSGWRVPTDEDWNQLSDFLGGINAAGGILKEKGFDHWLNPNTNATDSVNFNALPAGKGRDPDGTFSATGKNAIYWTSTFSRSGLLVRRLDYDDGSIHREEWAQKFALSVRCIKR
jgi:uncharacterized protein (TIGR02145 family)